MAKKPTGAGRLIRWATLTAGLEQENWSRQWRALLDRNASDEFDAAFETYARSEARIAARINKRRAAAGGKGRVVIVLRQIARMEKICEENGWSLEERGLAKRLAEKMGKSPRQVERYLEQRRPPIRHVRRKRRKRRNQK